jgi:hypothetical protein
MFNLFTQPQNTNTHCREVQVISSRYQTRTFKVYGDTEVCSIRALNEVVAHIPPAEPGETRQIKTYLGK